MATSRLLPVRDVAPAAAARGAMIARDLCTPDAPPTRVMTWNINGGYGLDPDDPTRLLGYENLAYFTALLRRIDADVVCLQKVHISAARSQADEIAHSLGLQGVFQSVASASHIDASCGLANAILTRRPFGAARAVTLPRPHFPVALPRLPSGEPAALYDKLVQLCS